MLRGTAIRLRRALILMAFTAASPAYPSEEHVCSGGQITVEGVLTALAEQFCHDAQASLEVLKRCAVTVKKPIRIRFRESLPPGCVGEYHCGEGLIDLLTPEAMSGVRKADGPLSHVSGPDYFRSVMAHEFAHAAYDDVPCPYANCRATSEYLAHAFQVMSLPEADRTALEAALDMETHVPRDNLNTFIYMLAPDKFLTKTWIHLNQRPDACAYIQGIIAGQVYMDRPHF